MTENKTPPAKSWQFIKTGGNAVAVILGSVVCVNFKSPKRAAVTGAAGLTAFSLAAAVSIYMADEFLPYEAVVIPMLFCAGLVFAAADTLVMEEGKDAAGSAPAIPGVGGYVPGCIVAPIAGLGDILHSTACAMLACSQITLFYAWQSYKLAPPKTA